MKKYQFLVLVTLLLTQSIFSQNVVSTKNGNWTDATVWSNSVVPTSSTNVTIANGHTVNIVNGNVQCNSLLVGTGSAALLNFSGANARSLSVVSDITVSPSATLNVALTSSATHTIDLKGNLINNGVFDLSTDGNSKAYMIFSNNGNQSITGSGSFTNIFKMVLNMGTSASNVLDISSTSFSTASNFLTLSNGTFKLSTPNAATLVPFTTAATIPASAGLWINSNTAIVSASAAVNLSGILSVSAGSMDIGNAANEDLVSTGGTLNISGGSLDIAGKYNASTGSASTFSISGGVLLVPSVSTGNTGVAPFHMSIVGSSFNMSGGLIVLRREGGNGSQDLGFINTGGTTGTVSGGTLQLGTTNSPASQTISINSIAPIPNLSIASGSITAKLLTNSLTVNNNISISSGTLNANNVNLSVGGNWTNAGSFVTGTATVIFNSSSAQSIFKSGGETFYGITFSGSGVKTLAAPLTANGNFSIATGSSVDLSASNFSLSPKRNFTNNGTFNARAGLVSLTGTVAQVIGGISVTDFYDLTLNNTTGASLSSAQNLKGSLNLNNGIFNTNSQVFTLISDANGTARIAQITGSGDISGNVTIQRFVPGGTTGWAFLGSPISSALTLNDWDDDIAISCPTCPDGSAGGFLSVYTYNEAAPGVYDAAASYVPLSTINDPITAGKGYWVYLGTGLNTTSNITLDLTGTVRKFGYSIPLVYTNNGSQSDDGWNLITNPYPSAISWTALRGVTANLDNAIYVYNADLNGGSGAFASFVNGVSSPAVGSGGIGDNIPMGQGFYVHSTGATAISAAESNKVSANPTFLKTNSTASPQNLLRLVLKGTNASLDETVLYCDAAATNAFDEGFDAFKMRGQDPNAASIALENQNELFQINGIAPINGTFLMDVKTLTGYSGTYTITTENLSSFPKGACIHLYDKFTNTSTDLRTQDYVFNLSDTTTIARFALSISILPLNIQSSLTQPQCVSPNSGKVVASGLNAGPWNYYWSINGVPVKTTLNHAGADTLINLSSGTIELEVNTQGLCDHHGASFVVQSQIPVTAGFSSPDTVHLEFGSTIQLQNNSLNGTNYYWDFGSLGTSNVASPQLTFYEAGQYSVSLIGTSSTGCTDTSSKIIRVMADLVSITEKEGSSTQLILKNFGESRFQLYSQSQTTKTYKVQLFDMNGSLIKDYGVITTDALKLDLDLNFVSKGIYYLRVNSDVSQSTLKLVRN